MMLHQGHSVMGALVALPFDYAPSLGPVGSKENYYPGSVEQDVFALNALGFFPDDGIAMVTEGSAAADIATESGAWAPDVRAATTKFQVAVGITADSWIGPQVRGELLKAITAANAGAPPPSLPIFPVPVDPGGVPARPASLPGVVPADPGLSTGEKVAIGAGVVGVLAGGYYLLK